MLFLSDIGAKTYDWVLFLSDIVLRFDLVLFLSDIGAKSYDWMLFLSDIGQSFMICAISITYLGKDL